MADERSRQDVIVSEHLSELRGKVRLLTWVSGLAWTVLVLFGGMLVTGLLDWFLHFDDSGLRLVLGLTLMGSAGTMAWRQLIRPLLQPLTASFLAMRIERRFPGLHSRVVSAVEFLQHRLDPKLGSSELQQAVVASALRDLETIEAHDVVETRSVKRVTIAGAVLFFVIGTIVILHPAEAATSVARLMFPFSNCPWPRQHRLQLVSPSLQPVSRSPDQPLRIARGDTLELYVIDGHGRLPERVWFEYRNGEDPTVLREPLRQTTLRDEAGRSYPAAVISWVAARGPLHFRAAGGDDDTMDFLRLDVVQPPTLESLQVTVTPPPYSGRPVEVLPKGVGHVQGLLGTELQVALISTAPLQSARLRVADKPPVALEIGEDRRTASIRFSIKDPGVTGYWFELTDEAGFSDPESPRFELRGIADGVPDVVIEQPVADVQVTAEAELPLRVLAKDDLGLARVRLAVTRPESPEIQEIPLVDADPLAEPLVVSTTDYLWKLASLSLKPGDRLVVRAEALDRYDLGPEPHLGKSTPRTITIVTAEEKQKELAGRVGDLLESLQQSATLQERALTQTRELQTQLGTTGQLRTQDLDQLHRIELDQRQTASRLTRPADGVQSQARQLQDEFRANRLDDPQTLQRLGRIVDDLANLERDQFPEIESALTRAAKTAEDLPVQVPEAGSEDTSTATGESNPSGPKATPQPSPAPVPTQSPDKPAPPPETPAPSAEKPTDSAAEPAATDKLKSSLSQAQTHQSAALKTLNDLQDVLSEWRNQRDIARELSGMIAEQEGLQKETSELGQQTLSKTGTDLTPQEKADLHKVADKQSKVAERIDQFRKQLQQAADSMKDRDPDVSERFQEAREELGTDGTAGKLREASQGISENQIGSASQLQQQALQELRDLDKQLKREPTDDVETLIKQIESAESEFEMLRKEQAELRDATRQAAAEPDSPQRREQLEQLQQRQQELKDKLDAAERRLERLRLRQPTEAAERAQERLDRIQQQLQDPGQAEEAAEEMQQVVDDLEQVERDLAQERQFAQEQLAIEELEKIEAQLRAVLSQQKGVIEETERLATERAMRGSLTRAQLKTVRDLAEVERGLQGDIESLEESLRTAEVVALVLRRAGRTLKLAADRLGEKQVDDSVVAIERDVVKRIEGLLAILTAQDPPPADQQAPMPGGEQQPQDQEDKPQAAQPPGESLPQLAQLKLLKALQEEFLERTALLDQLRDADGKFPESARMELEELAKEQAELADLTRDLVVKMLKSQPDPDDAPPGEQGPPGPGGKQDPPDGANGDPMKGNGDEPRQDAGPRPGTSKSDADDSLLDDLLKKKPERQPLPKRDAAEGELP